MHFLWWWVGTGTATPVGPVNYDDEYLWLGEGRDGAETLSLLLSAHTTGGGTMVTRLGPSSTTSTLSPHLDADIGTTDIFPND